MDQKILILNFGGQYDQLIARRVRENGVYCEIHPYDMSLDAIRQYQPIGIIFTGGPQSVYKPHSPHPVEGVFALGVPILGICYGCQLIAHHLGGLVTEAQSDTAREYGKTLTRFDTSCAIFEGLDEQSVSWMSHGDYLARIPQGFAIVAHSDNCPTVGIADNARRIYGVQFHPEVNHTQQGKRILRNFLAVCGAKGNWSMTNYAQRAIADIRHTVGDGKVLLALSGGVDSSVAAALLAEAVGAQLTCVLVDHGLMRLNEVEEVKAAFAKWDITLLVVDAKERFLTALKGVEEPERKRKIIGEQFIRVFEQIGRQIGSVDYLAQGTIYPDVIESGKGPAETIKSHHNVGGLPDFVAFKAIIEPLRMLFKDEVRALGKTLGLPDYLVNRQPFPGPGLGVRVVGEITEEKLDIVRRADAIFRQEVEKAGLSSAPDQYFAALSNMRSVGVMGDGRSYDYAVVLRAVSTEDFMTANWTKLPYDVLDAAAVRIVNEVPHVNRVLYDITGKPPATVELE